MADLEERVQENQMQIARIQSVIRKLTCRIEETYAKIHQGIFIDVQNASLEEADADANVVTLNIAELVMALDDVTADLAREFEGKRSRTTVEAFIHMFMRRQSDCMRQKRLRSAFIDVRLQNVVSNSNSIMRLLVKQAATIDDQRSRIEANILSTGLDREGALAHLESVRAEIEIIESALFSLEKTLGAEQDAARRVETEKANRCHDNLIQAEQVALTRVQMLDRYVENGTAWVDSLRNQAAKQVVLIDKLAADSKQRLLFGETLDRAPRAARQEEFDRADETQTRTSRHMKSTMVQKAEADDRFIHRFPALANRHDKGPCGIWGSLRLSSHGERSASERRGPRVARFTKTKHHGREPHGVVGNHDAAPGVPTSIKRLVPMIRRTNATSCRPGRFVFIKLGATVGHSCPKDWTPVQVSDDGWNKIGELGATTAIEACPTGSWAAAKWFTECAIGADLTGAEVAVPKASMSTPRQGKARAVGEP